MSQLTEKLFLDKISAMIPVNKAIRAVAAPAMKQRLNPIFDALKSGKISPEALATTRRNLYASALERAAAARKLTKQAKKARQTVQEGIMQQMKMNTMKLGSLYDVPYLDKTAAPISLGETIDNFNNKYETPMGAGMLGLGLGGLGIARAAQAAATYDSALYNELLAAVPKGEGGAVVKKMSSFPARMAKRIANNKAIAKINSINPLYKYGLPAVVALSGATSLAHGLYNQANRPWYEKLKDQIMD